MLCLTLANGRFQKRLSTTYKKPLSNSGTVLLETPSFLNLQPRIELCTVSKILIMLIMQIILHMPKKCIMQKMRIIRTC
jgi:hypothetical protein